MKIIKKYEDFWPFSKSFSEKEINQKKILDLPKKIKLSGLSKKILDLNVSNINIGYSTKDIHRLVIEFKEGDKRSVRVNFIINDDYFITKKDSCFLIVDDNIVIHNLRVGQNKNEIRQLDKIQEDIFELAKKEGLVKNN